MNLYSEANKYFEEILKEENAKLNESLKKKKLKESIISRKKLREDDSTKSALNWADRDAIESLIKKSMGKIVREIPQIENSSYHYSGWASFDKFDDIINEVRHNLDWRLDKLSPEEAEYSYGVFRDYNIIRGENVNDKIESGKMRLFNDYRKAIDYAESITKPDGKQTRIYLIVGKGDNKLTAGDLWLKMLDPTEKIKLNSPAYNEILSLVKGNKKAANILRKWLEYVTWESSEELEDEVDRLLNDLIQEGGTPARDAKVVADAIGWNLEDNTPSFPPIWYSVWELTEDGEEIDELDRFDTKEKAIAFAKKQSVPTHVVFLPEEDPDDDPDYAEYIEYTYDYEPFEVVWESGVDESFNRKRNLMREAANSISDIKHLNLRDYGKGYRPPYAFDGAVYFDVKDNSLGRGINQLQAWEVDIAYNERRRRWFVDSDVAQGSGKTVKECVINTFKDFVNQSSADNLGNANETSLGNAIDDRFVNYDAAPGESFPLYLIDMYHNN